MSDVERALQALCAQLSEAVAAGVPVRVVGGDTKAFYGRSVHAQQLATTGLCGIVAYEPSELVLTAWAGTPLGDIEAALAGRGQMLAFEPPHFGAGGTLGGAIASGLSGPRRPYAGSVRDYVLGVRCLTAAGDVLRFGGQVMKNVAGYDVSRLLTGSLGTLAVITEVSLKVLPQPEVEATRRLDIPVAAAIEQMNAIAGKPLPLSAAAYDDDSLWLRLSGAEPAVRSACAQLGGDRVDDAGVSFWRDLRDHRLEYFLDDAPLWRLSLPPATTPVALSGEWLVDWGGAQRWLKSHAGSEEIRTAARIAGGHATLFRGGDRNGEVFTTLDPVSWRIHRGLKSRFDPNRILNRGRMYKDL